MDEFRGGLCRALQPGGPARETRAVAGGLLLLKQLHNLGDETVVAQPVQNPYWQFFCGMSEFPWSLPCDPSDLVYFRAADWGGRRGGDFCGLGAAPREEGGGSGSGD